MMIVVRISDPRVIVSNVACRFEKDTITLWNICDNSKLMLRKVT